MSVCTPDSDFDGENMGARIASVFVILVLSAAGSFLPLVAGKYAAQGVPQMALFVTRYFGSGVIVATAFIHLLGESHESLGNECLPAGFSEYPVSSALALAGSVAMFTVEAITHRCMDRSKKYGLDEEHGTTVQVETVVPAASNTSCSSKADNQVFHETQAEHDAMSDSEPANLNDILRALIYIYLLEFGIVFHSVFVGLSLAISGHEFKTLFVAISFHQFFEGLGLGSRFATAVWPANLHRMPWYLSLAYTVTTPVAIAVGLGVRNLYSVNSPTSLIVVGIFDGFCAGLLIYNSMVELMARDFNKDPAIRGGSRRRFCAAYTMFLLGAGLMALLGRWA